MISYISVLSLVLLLILFIVYMYYRRKFEGVDHSGLWCLDDNGKQCFGLTNASLFLKKIERGYDGYLVMNNSK